MEPQFKSGPLYTMTESQRVAGTPYLTMSLTSPSTLSLNRGQFCITAIITLHSSSSQPITIKKSIIHWKLDGATFALFHKSPEGLDMVEDNDGLTGPTPYNEPSGFVEPATSPDFVTIMPGESYSDWFDLKEASFEEPFKVGEKYVYRFNGHEVEWWSWGSKKDLEGKRVPEEEVAMAKQSGPKLVIPASEFVEFEVVE